MRATADEEMEACAAVTTFGAHVEQYHAYLGNAQNKDDHNIDDCSEDDHNRMQNYRK